MQDRISRAELIESAAKHSKFEVEDAIEALELLIGEGFCDEMKGSVSEWPFVHAARVDNWLLVTNELGSRSVYEFDSADEASAGVERMIPNMDEFAERLGSALGMGL